MGSRYAPGRVGFNYDFFLFLYNIQFIGKVTIFSDLNRLYNIRLFHQANERFRLFTKPMVTSDQQCRRLRNFSECLNVPETQLPRVADYDLNPFLKQPRSLYRICECLEDNNTQDDQIPPKTVDSKATQLRRNIVLPFALSKAKTTLYDYTIVIVRYNLMKIENKVCQHFFTFHEIFLYLHPGAIQSNWFLFLLTPFFLIRLSFSIQVTR